MNIEKQFKEIVETTIKEKNISKRKLAKMTDLSYQTLMNIFYCKPSSTTTMNKILKVLDLSVTFNKLD